MEGIIRILRTVGKYYPELKLKMVNKLYANILFCVKLSKSYVISVELHPFITSLLQQPLAALRHG